MKITDQVKHDSSILIENLQEEIEVKSELIKLLEETALSSLTLEGMTSGCELNIMLSDDERIKEMNREFRNVDQATDVLSFPMVEMQEGRIISDVGDYDMDEGLLVLGDIVISLETAKRQADEYGHSFERECAFLASHGAFHLLGYDHENEAQEARMVMKQEEVLEKLGLKRV